jgi:hypothetical protein
MPEPFLHLSPSDRADALEVAAAELGRPAGLLEKDVWVVWTLDALFRQGFGSVLTFKGGTSLSKVFRVIDRFSEDIDLTYDIRSLLPEFAGELGDPIPGSRSAADKITVRARNALRTWVAAEAGPAVESALSKEGVPEATVEVQEANLVVAYPASVDTPTGYVAPRVLVEFGGRSSGEPASIHPVECDVAQSLRDLAFPKATPRVMEVERTFWEKATAAHVFCLQHNLRGERFSRHWYDLALLHQHGVSCRALADRDLAKKVADHKSRFFRENSASGKVVDYQAAVTGALSLVPEGEGRRVLAADYEQMSGSGLLPVGAPSFDEVMAHCAEIEARANAL